MRVRLLASLAVSVVLATEDAAEINPIRKVVNLLQAMQRKVSAEGEKEKELYDKFMCYCTKGGGDLTTSISSAEIKVPAVSSDIKVSDEKLTQNKADLKSAQADRAAAKKAIADATAIREKEASAYAKEKAEYDANIAAINKAVSALERGMAGGFLQTRSAQLLKKLALNKQDMLDVDRQELVAFLSGSQGSDYGPKSGEISGILKELGENMEKSRSEIVAEEKSAIANYKELTAAKTREISALGASVERKTQQIGELGVHIVQMKEDLTDTQAALMQDQEFLGDLKKSCATKTSEWEERSRTRADELVALADTIKVLNDDDSLELFKKTLPGASASFMQVTSSLAQTRVRVLTLLRQAHQAANLHDKPGFDFLTLALLGRKSLAKGGFEKVIQMIDKMVEILKAEQRDDDDKKEYCGIQLDQTDDKKKSVVRAIEDADRNVASATESMATLREEIKSLEAGIKALDKSVAEATDQRKTENAEYRELMASNGAAKELLLHVKNRLNKFYNPKLYNPPAKNELDAQTRISVNMGAEAEPMTAPSGIAGTGIEAMLAQISVHKLTMRESPGLPPATWGAYSKKSGESSGVISMLNLLIKDLDKEMTEAETSEKNSQADYRMMMGDSTAKRSADSKSLSGKVGTLAETEGLLESHKEDQRASGRDLLALTKYIASLHAECDWLLQYYDVRKEARASEVDSLARAKAVLSGAGFAALQTASRGFLRRW